VKGQRFPPTKQSARKIKKLVERMAQDGNIENDDPELVEVLERLEEFRLVAPTQGMLNKAARINAEKTKDKQRNE
jgi:hypothetical protein